MMNLKTELCLGVGGGVEVDQSVKMNGKRGFSETVDLKLKPPTHQNDDPALDLTQKPQSLSNHSLIKPPAKYVVFFENFNFLV